MFLPATMSLYLCLSGPNSYWAKGGEAYGLRDAGISEHPRSTWGYQGVDYILQAKKEQRKEFT